MNGMGSNTGGGGQGPGPIRGISPHPMMDAFSGLGSQPQNTRQMPQIRRPY